MFSIIWIGSEVTTKGCRIKDKWPWSAWSSRAESDEDAIGVELDWTEADEVSTVVSVPTLADIIPEISCSSLGIVSVSLFSLTSAEAVFTILIGLGKLSSEEDTGSSLFGQVVNIPCVFWSFCEKYLGGLYVEFWSTVANSSCVRYTGKIWMPSGYGVSSVKSKIKNNLTILFCCFNYLNILRYI